MSVMDFRKPLSHSGNGPEQKTEQYELFRGWKIPLNATWVLDFAAWDYRYVYTGSKTYMRKRFMEVFQHDLVYRIDNRKPETEWGNGWKISPISEFLLLGFGPLLEGAERNETLKAAKRLSDHGPEYVPDLGNVIRERIAREYDAMGLRAPVNGFWGYQEPQQGSVWDAELVPSWLRCQTFCFAASGTGLHKPKLVN